MAESNEAQGQRSGGEAAGAGHICPWWIGWLLLSPLRRLFESPERLLGPHVRPGMTVLEPGCGMGFFSLPLARMVGPAGRVVCVDLQSRMIAGLRRRAERAGLAGRIEAITGTLDEAALEARRGAVDVAVAIHMVHEVRDGAAFVRRLFEMLRPGGRLLIVEPKGHVSAGAFEGTVVLATAAGFAECGRPLGPGGRAVLLERPAGDAV
ncbi:MAG: methyltransferase domain-containing protein [Deltaproteobacteria bacterium]|nr:methyltransferase domain-containing protein [Deltaproteobacteria bacterium]